MRISAWSACALLTLAACGGDDTHPEPHDPDAGALTFWQDVAPIYFDNCVDCHQQGGIAPFSLDNYEDAKTWAQSARLATESRTMPPYLVTADGSCGEFHDPRWLADEDIATIAQWVESGAVEGTPRNDLATPVRPPLPGTTAYSTPEFVPEIVGDSYAEFDEYRCFLIDPDLPADTFITGYEVVPGNAAVVHHVLVMTVDPDLVVDPDNGVTNRDVMEHLDGLSPDRDGWPCFSAAGEGVAPSALPVTWAPGMGAVEYPDQTGVTVAKDDQIVVQVHYNLADEEVRGQSDSTTVKLRYDSSVSRQGFFTLPDGFLETLFTGEPATLEPGRESITFTWEQNFDEELMGLGLPYVDIYGVMPHMHELGSKWRLEVVRGDTSDIECGGNVESWDFGWQLFYMYDRPIRFNLGDRLRVTCDFDTRSVSDPVYPGWGTQNEMCLAGLYLVAPAQP